MCLKFLLENPYFMTLTDLLDLWRLHSPSFDEVSPQLSVSHKRPDVHGAVKPGVAPKCIYKRQCRPATSSNPLSRLPEK